MPKRQLDSTDLIALNKENQSSAITKAQASAKKAKKLLKSGGKLTKSVKKPAILHVRQLPRVLDEQDLRDYFTQFGSIKRVKLGRSNKTGNSKGYCFIEFHEEKMAKICCNSMQGYLLFNCLLKCKVLSNETELEKANNEKLFNVYYRNNVDALAAIKRLKDKREDNEGIRFLTPSGERNSRNAKRAIVNNAKKRAAVAKKLAAVGISVEE